MYIAPSGQSQHLDNNHNPIDNTHEGDRSATEAEFDAGLCDGEVAEPTATTPPDPTSTTPPDPTATTPPDPTATTPPDPTATTPAETGEITVLKRFCEADNSPNANSNCNGRVEDAEGDTVRFEVREGDANIDGVVLENIDVLIAQQGNGSQGQATGGELEAGDTFTVCEIEVDGFIAVPRPGAQGGQNQTGIDGEPCIVVELVPGNNVLQFNNFVQAEVVPTATATTEPTATMPPGPTATTAPGEPTATSAPVEPTATTAPVNTLPDTGTNGGGAGNTATLLLIVAASAIFFAAATAIQRSKDASR